MMTMVLIMTHIAIILNKLRSQPKTFSTRWRLSMTRNQLPRNHMTIYCQIPTLNGKRGEDPRSSNSSRRSHQKDLLWVSWRVNKTIKVKRRTFILPKISSKKRAKFRFLDHTKGLNCLSSIKDHSGSILGSPPIRIVSKSISIKASMIRSSITFQEQSRKTRKRMVNRSYIRQLMTSATKTLVLLHLHPTWSEPR